MRNEAATPSPALWIAYANNAREYYEIRQTAAEAFDAFAHDWEGPLDDVVVEDLCASPLLPHLLANVNSALRLRNQCGEAWPTVRHHLLDQGWILGDLGV
jgi:hypothetical protein